MDEPPTSLSSNLSPTPEVMCLDIFLTFLRCAS